jgi:hypothetical protein
MENNILQKALEYCNRELSVIPVGKDKTPLILWKEFQERRATREEIIEWWKKYPDANVGIVTGKISNLLVIDCDSKETIDFFTNNYTGETPCVKTPRGQHFYFQHHDGVTNAAMVGGRKLDVRGSGGYIIAPPSINREGIAYSFIKDFSIASLDSIINLHFLYKEITSTEEKVKNRVTLSHNILQEGHRDDDLFHIANCLVKGNCEKEVTQQVLNILAQKSNPPFPLNEIQNKINSAIERANRRERNIMQEVKDWLESQNGVFRVTDYYVQSQVVTKHEKHAAIMAFRRLKEQGIIESYGNRAGEYRKINNEVEYINWQDADESEYPLELPLNIHHLVKLYPGNIAILAGASNTGKTSFMLETIRLNQRKHPVTYLNSEMAAPELKLRLKLFSEVISLDKWQFKAIERSSNFADVIDPDGFNVIDFMEIYDEFWKIGGWIRDIHVKLKKGIAIIALQKKTTTKKNPQDFGRGGELTLEKPRLYLAMDRGKIKIVKAKIWRNHERNPNGLIRDFKIVQGWKFLPQDEWYTEDDRKYTDFIHED